MTALPTPSTSAWQPLSPAHPRADAEHEARTVSAVSRALREIPFYQKRGDRPPAAATPVHEALARLPLLFKNDVRATLPRQWVPDRCDVRAQLASGALELVETSGSTGERLRVLWDEGWWMRQ